MTNPLPIPILGVDAEAKSLHGRAFCAALVLAEPDGLTFRDEFVVRCPLVGDPDPLGRRTCTAGHRVGTSHSRLLRGHG